MSYRIPFNRACLVGTEEENVAAAVAGGHTSGDGPFTARCEQWIEDQVECERALLTTNCTHALELAALLLDIGPGDEVILPSFTFVSTANAFVLRGAAPIFADVDASTLNMDPACVSSLVSPRTRAIVPVHYGGVGCDMDELLDIATGTGAAIVEDNAHGLLGRYRSRPLGSMGALATLSFHETKNFTCGEGGALIVNDPALVERAEIVRQKGTNRNQFLRGVVDKYTWVDVGSSYALSDILAAMLWSQLEAAEAIQRRRQKVWETYAAALEHWADDVGARLPTVPSDRDQAFHLFYVLLPTKAARDALIDHLLSEGILSVFHYQPLHLSAMGRRTGGAVGQCPVTEDLADRLVRLPFYNSLAADEQAMVIEAVVAAPLP